MQDAAGHADPRTTRRYDRVRHNLDEHATYALAGSLSLPRPAGHECPASCREVHSPRPRDVALRTALTAVLAVGGLSLIMGSRHGPAAEAAAAEPAIEAPSSSAAPGRFDPGRVVGFLTLLSLALYAVSYLLAQSFYRQLGVTPEDVGWTQVRAIARLGVVGGLLLVVYALLSTVGSILLYVLANLLRKWLGWEWSTTWSRVERIVAVGLIMLLLGVAWSGLHASVLRSARDLRATGTVDLGSVTAYVAGVDVPAVTALWTRSGPGSTPVTTNSLVYLLGQANGTTVVFDACVRQTFRIPSAALFMAQANEASDKPMSSTSEQAAQPARRREVCQSLGRPVS